MGYSDEELSYIYDKNDGYCWHCGIKLAWSNYALVGGGVLERWTTVYVIKRRNRLSSEPGPIMHLRQ